MAGAPVTVLFKVTVIGMGLIQAVAESGLSGSVCTTMTPAGKPELIVLQTWPVVPAAIVAFTVNVATAVGLRSTVVLMLPDPFAGHTFEPAAPTPGKVIAQDQELNVTPAGWRSITGMAASGDPALKFVTRNVYVTFVGDPGV